MRSKNYVTTKTQVWTLEGNIYEEETQNSIKTILSSWSEKTSFQKTQWKNIGLPADFQLLGTAKLQKTRKISEKNKDRRTSVTSRMSKTIYTF